MGSKQPVVRVEVNDSESKASGHNKDISYAKIYHFTIIKLGRSRKKFQVWSQHCPSDSWTVQEDTYLSRAVYKYGPYWELVSD
jgi:hypothetical protein